MNYIGNLGPLFIISRFLWRCYKNQRALSKLRFSASISNTLLGYIIWWEITFLSTVPRHIFVFINVFILRHPFSGRLICTIRFLKTSSVLLFAINYPMLNVKRSEIHLNASLAFSGSNYGFV